MAAHQDSTCSSSPASTVPPLVNGNGHINGNGRLVASTNGNVVASRAATTTGTAATVLKPTAMVSPVGVTPPRTAVNGASRPAVAETNGSAMLDKPVCKPLARPSKRASQEDMKEELPATKAAFPSRGADEENTIGKGENKLLKECLAMEAKVNHFLSEDPATLGPRLRGVQEQVRIAIGVIRRALVAYSLPSLSLSYNGGKDCLVLLVLLLATLPSVYHTPSSTCSSSSASPFTSQCQCQSPSTSSSSSASPLSQTPCTPLSSPSPSSSPSFPMSLQSVYVVSRHPFPEVDAFVDSTAAKYSLDLDRYSMGMKQALQAYLDDKKRQKKTVEAVFVGTRRTDPHGAKLSHFDETDGGWPRFMRIHPVLDWHYVDIWAFIKHLKIPYCELYDRGYTSLGGTTDTHPNPALRRTKAGEKKGHGAGDGEEESFRPAYELYEDEAERLGRDS